MDMFEYANKKKAAGMPAKQVVNKTGIPDAVKGRFENQSGFSFDNVRVHYNSDKPARLRALAYTQGNQVYIGPGAERHLGHELGHVVQQKMGIVRPRIQTKYGAANNDNQLEHDADRINELAARIVPTKNRSASTAGFTTEVKQFARSKEASPILANERHLLKDVKAILKGHKRKDLDEDGKFLDTTYDNIGDNLLLDVNMLFEENLQREIEESSYFLACLETAVAFIHQKIDFGVPGMQNPKPMLKKPRIKAIEDYLGKISKQHEEVTTESLQAKDWAFEPEGTDLEVKRTAIGYVKLLKMLKTQFGYFGGAQEYDEDETDKFEYWIYHMSTLTKDPTRQYRADEPGASLVKPMIDYRTHDTGIWSKRRYRKDPYGRFVPYHNQRNLGTGIAEARWDELPITFQRLIATTLQKRQKERSLAIRGTQITTTNLPKQWDTFGEEGKKQLYGDLLRIPFASIQESGPPNVVGVKGNLLETPDTAALRYQRDLETMKQKLKPAQTLSALLRTQEIPTQGGEGADEESILLQDFKERHREWYKSSKKHHKPIVGGISGHTLGYLNLYEGALGIAEREEFHSNPHIPTMEELRACMLGALIGDKRHHSYDEVMTASQGMPTHSHYVYYDTAYGYSTLRYLHRSSYDDILESNNDAISGTGFVALMETKSSIDFPEKNTVLGVLIEKFWDYCILFGEDYISEIQGILYQYMTRALDNKQAARYINALVAHMQHRKMHYKAMQYEAMQYGMWI